jgi:hypothetical protein
MRKIRVSIFLLAPVLFLLMVARDAESNRRLVLASGGGEGAHADIFVKEVKVSPLRAHVGDVIRFDMRWVYWGEMNNRYYETTKAEILANGKVVASIPFVYNYSASLGDEYDHTWFWDTRGFPPGEYRIKGVVFLWLDATPYDNFLVVKDQSAGARGGVSQGAGSGRNGGGQEPRL